MSLVTLRMCQHLLLIYSDKLYIMHFPTYEETVVFAKEAHAGQKDKAGADYFGHVERVAAQVSGEAKIVALLHDTLEDTDCTPRVLLEKGYPQHIVDAVIALTKRPEEEGSDAGYESFIHRAAQNPLALGVKIADIRDNMDLSRIAHPSPKDYARIEKYRKALEFLESQISS